MMNRVRILFNNGTNFKHRRASDSKPLYLFQSLGDNDLFCLQLSTNTFGVFRRPIFMDDLQSI